MNHADLKAMLAEAGMTLEILSPAQYAEAMLEVASSDSVNEGTKHDQ